MQLVIDILLIAIFALLVFRGWWRGFMKSILSLGRLILSLVITILFGSAFAAWIDAKFVNPPVFEAVFKKFSDVAAEITASAEGGIDALVVAGTTGESPTLTDAEKLSAWVDACALGKGEK